MWISLLKFYIGPQHGKSSDENSGFGGSSGSSSYISSYSSAVGGSGDTMSGSGGSGLTGNAGIMNKSPDCNATYLQIWQGKYGKQRTHL